MYTVSLVLPGTKEGMEELQKKYTRIMAKITADMLSNEELKCLIDKLENKKQ